MKPYAQLTQAERGQEYARLQQEFNALKAKGLSRRKARGTPGKAQLDRVRELFGLRQRPEA